MAASALEVGRSKGWRTVPLGQVCTFRAGGKLKLTKKDYATEGFPAFSATGQDGFVRVRENSGTAVILSSIGARCGKAFFANGDWTTLANTQILTPNPTELDARYLWYFANDEKRWPRSGSAQPFIAPTEAKAVPIPLPPLDIQKGITARIDELFADLDDGEEDLRRARAELETYRKALLRAAFTGELTDDWRAAHLSNESVQQLLDSLVLSEPTTSKGRRSIRSAATIVDAAGLPPLPDRWTWTTVGRLGAVSGGLTKNAKRAALALVLPYLRVANVGAGSLNLERVETIGLTLGEASRVRLMKGDLLIVEGNGSIDQIGRSAVWEGQIDPCAHQNHLIKVRFSDQRLPAWVQLWLQSPHGRQELEAKASSTSGLHTLSISKIEAVRCPLPPSSELSKVLEITKDALAFGETAGTEASSIRSDSAALRQSILGAAFRGDLVQ
jgi:type I restriction enzyme, S subunit